MAVLTKTKKPNKRPRCEDTAATGQRCCFSGREMFEGVWRCGPHVKKARNKGRNPWQIINKDA